MTILDNVEKYLGDLLKIILEYQENAGYLFHYFDILKNQLYKIEVFPPTIKREYEVLSMLTYRAIHYRKIKEGEDFLFRATVFSSILPIKKVSIPIVSYTAGSEIILSVVRGEEYLDVPLILSSDFTSLEISIIPKYERGMPSLQLKFALPPEKQDKEEYCIIRNLFKLFSYPRPEEVYTINLEEFLLLLLNIENISYSFRLIHELWRKYEEKIKHDMKTYYRHTEKLVPTVIEENGILMNIIIYPLMKSKTEEEMDEVYNTFSTIFNELKDSLEIISQIKESVEV